MDKIKDNEHLKNEVDTLRQESSAEIEQLRTTVDAKKMEIESFIEKIDELHDSILIKDAELMKHREDLERESGANKQLQTKMDLHQEEMDKEIQRLESDLDDSRRELSDRQTEMKVVREELVMKHKESIEMKETAISKIEEKNNKLEALIGTKAAAIKKLESDLLGMEKMNSQLTEDNARKEEALASQLAMMEETKEEVTESRKHQTAEFMQMKLELAASRQELADKHTHIGRLQTVHDKMRADLEKLSQTNRDLQILHLRRMRNSSRKRN